ncbi:MAG: diacylglycerol kinase [Bacteroidetes bacterium]|nr:MAG: diacylglycerol kinase [Bacteroidota bacterium]
MKIVNLLHNPDAGNEDHSEEKLVSLLEANGFECRYSSMNKKNWKKIEEEVDFIVAAGGDGTIRKITKELLARKLSEKTWPIGLLPLGTANNIAQTLEINESTEDIIQSWHHPRTKNFDVGRIRGLPDTTFFLESFGYGLFPFVIRKMKKIDKSAIESSDMEIKTALEILHESIFTYEPKYCELNVDGTDHSGKFLLAEIMNTRLIGPNLFLSPHGDPGDGQFEVILIPQKDKEKLASYVSDKMKGIDEPYHFEQLKGKNIKVMWEGTHVHADDEIIKLEKNEKIEIELREGLLKFLVPN